MQSLESFERVWNLYQSLRINRYYVAKNKKTFIYVYVDDLLLFDENINHLNIIKFKLSNRFKMTNLKLVSHYLNMSIESRNERVNLNQTIYLQSVLERFEMSNCKSSFTLMKSNLFNIMMSIDDELKIDADVVYWYESIIESLMYAITMTRLDLRYALFVLSRYYANSDVTHIKTTTRVLRYVKETLSYKIHYEGTTRFVSYIDANWAKVRDDRRSTEDWLFFLSKDSIL